MPNLTIHVDQQQPVFTNGDTISGHITLQVNDRIDLNEITIELLGISETRISNSQGPGKSYRSHVLVKRSVRVFPEQFSELKSSHYTLGNGTYSYPFSLQFPSSTTPIECIANSFTGRCGFIYHNTIDAPATIPPTFYYGLFEDFARVTYQLVAVIHKHAFYKLNLRASHPLFFSPKNSWLSFSLSHIYDGKRSHIMRNSETVDCKIGFQSTAPPATTFVKRLLSSSTISLPFVAVCQFKPFISRTFNEGTTNRLLPVDTPLPDLLDIKLISLISPKEIRKLLNNDDDEAFNSKKKRSTTHNNTPPEQIVITRLRVSLQELITFSTTVQKGAVNEFAIQDTTLNHTLNLDTDFDRMPISSVPIAKKITDKWGNRITEHCYGMSLFPEWFNAKIPRTPQSFVCCNIQNDYTLSVRLDLSTTLGKKNSSAKCYCPVVILRDESTNAVPEDVPQYTQDIQPGELSIQDTAPQYTEDELPNYSAQ
ncbi:hypothetical protein DASC09_047840 [Saccharomycopsis crataegensis]|uniref:Arrestin-like N-terminal domain-containing protein n=1 Tax=Saccharomycopsis crataegensis TaxID=43959 RepID=A0AAV5QRT8_9ASCO|nr:hypothetical protein DASC09_047840 [Saccharomycopsis crataegensis]